MFRFPFYGYQYSNPYYRYQKQYMNNLKNSQINKTENSITNSTKISNTINQTSNSHDSNNQYTSENQAIFEIFGIKLYMDDLIIIGLLYFLYQENVKDEMLYIILFLLLFS